MLALSRWLEGEPRRAFEGEAAALFARLAVFEDGLANWRAVVGESPGLLAGARPRNWCDGGHLVMDLLLAAAELVWRAGAPRTATGPGICCGTAGNGYALLKVFERTGDERWLDRARRFAVHALEQVEETRPEAGPAGIHFGRATRGRDLRRGLPRGAAELPGARLTFRAARWAIRGRSGQRSARAPHVSGPAADCSGCTDRRVLRQLADRLPGRHDSSSSSWSSSARWLGTPAPGRSAALPGPGILSSSLLRRRHSGTSASSSYRRLITPCACW